MWLIDYDNIRPMSLDKEQIASIQEFRLRALLKRVYADSPFYHRLMRDRNLTPEDVAKDITKIPFTTKEDLRKSGYPYGGDFLTVPLSTIVGWHMTSGTTGKPTIGAYTAADMKLWRELVARCLLVAGVKKDDIIANIYGYGLFTGGLGLHIGAQELGAKVIPWGTGRTEALINTVIDFQATVITGTPSYELVILEKMREMGLDPTETKLRIAIPGAEAMSPDTLDRIEEGFGLKGKGGGAREIYGMTEAIGPGVAQECPEDEHKFMHIWTDHFLVEIIDPETGEHVGEGEDGELVLTTLTREGMPLLRYRTRDLTRMEESSDRLPFPKISIIKGRSDDVVFYRGVKIYPTAIAHVMHFHKEVIEYQVTISKDASLFLIKVETKTPSEELRKRLIEEIQSVVFARPQVEFASPGELPRYEGKAKRVIII
ncbi:phenylacetate--CoA ligase [Sulfolobales archaeon HS-7]|nr:phenylacetate--CoA ligase [Sulfolobales archaeon HS-7]